MTAKEVATAKINELGLIVEAEFVPQSEVSNRKEFADCEPSPGLHWVVTVKRGGRSFKTCYSAGVGHCPSYKQRQTCDDRACINWECQHGYPAKMLATTGIIVKKPHAKPLIPDAADVLYCLCSDADVLYSGNFEEWASEFGYDADSRKAKRTYQACMRTAHNLLGLLGDRFQELRDAFQDY